MAAIDRLRGYALVVEYDPLLLLPSADNVISTESGLVLTSDLRPGAMLLSHTWTPHRLPRPPVLRFDHLNGRPEVRIGHGVVRETGGTIRPLSSSRQRSSGRPERLLLHPNFPNPFDPRTTIRYRILETTLCHEQTLEWRCLMLQQR